MKRNESKHTKAKQDALEELKKININNKSGNHKINNDELSKLFEYIIKSNSLAFQNLINNGTRKTREDIIKIGKHLKGLQESVKNSPLAWDLIEQQMRKINNQNDSKIEIPPANFLFNIMSICANRAEGGINNRTISPLTAWRINIIMDCMVLLGICGITKGKLFSNKLQYVGSCLMHHIEGVENNEKGIAKAIRMAKPKGIRPLILLDRHYKYLHRVFCKRFGENAPQVADLRQEWIASFKAAHSGWMGSPLS